MHSHELVQQLDVIPAEQLGAHLPTHVVAQLPARGVTVFAVSDDASDTAEFSARYGFGLEDCAALVVCVPAALPFLDLLVLLCQLKAIPGSMK